MKKRTADEGVPESDCVEDAPHPRHNHLLFGHGDAERQLLEAYRSGRLPQAWIIGGQEGVGKATLAWRFARFLFANPLFDSPAVARASDLSVSPDDPVSRRIDAMAIGDLALLRREWNEKTKKHFTEIRMDDVRHALELFHHAAGEGGWRICIVDCAEDLNRSGANALLKVMEEPPPRSLFLIISHRPARILPTIRSRCRMLQLEPLTADEVSQTVRSLGEPWSHMGAEIDAAAQRAGGSVKQALRYLDKDTLELAESVESLLSKLPQVDWHGVHRLGDQIAGSAAVDDFYSVTDALFEWLDAQVHLGAQAGEGADRLAPYAEVWEKVADAVREAEALNLDKRPLVLSIFADLAAAVRAARS